MTTHTPAPAQQAVLTDDQIEALARKHLAPKYDQLRRICPDRPPYQQSYQFRCVKALIVDVLSKLRAPVAGEAQSAIGFVDPLYVAGRQRGMKWNAKIYDAPNQEATAPLYAAPQASEAVRDAARLEFLITYGAWVAWSKDHELCRVFHRDEDGDIEPFLGWRESARAAAYTARDAIDAAMAALSAQPGAQKNGGSDGR